MSKKPRRSGKRAVQQRESQLLRCLRLVSPDSLRTPWKRGKLTCRDHAPGVCGGPCLFDAASASRVCLLDVQSLSSSSTAPMARKAQPCRHPIEDKGFTARHLHAIDAAAGKASSVLVALGRSYLDPLTSATYLPVFHLCPSLTTAHHALLMLSITLPHLRCQEGGMRG